MRFHNRGPDRDLADVSRGWLLKSSCSALIASALCLLAPAEMKADPAQVESACQALSAGTSRGPLMSLEAQQVTFRGAQGAGRARLTLSELRLSPCAPLRSWLYVTGRRLTLDEDWLVIEGARLGLTPALELPLPDLTLARSNPWRWLQLPSLGWSRGALRAVVPLSFPLSQRLILHPRVGWWGGPLLGSSLSVDGGSLALSWSRLNQYELHASLAQQVKGAGGLSLWLLGQRLSRPLSVGLGSLQGWAERAVMGRDELWGGLSLMMRPGLDLRLSLAQLSPPARALSAGRAQLEWSSLGEAQRLSLSLSGLMTRGDSFERLVRLSGQYQRSLWLKALRVRARAEAQAWLREGGARSAEPQLEGLGWARLGLGSQGSRVSSSGVSSLDLELLAELIGAKISRREQGSEQGSLSAPYAPLWAERRVRAPSLARAGLTLSERWSPREVGRLSAGGLSVGLWGGGWLELEPLSDELLERHKALQAATLGELSAESWGALSGLTLRLELGSTAEERWGSGELRAGSTLYSAARWVRGWAPAGLWGLTSLHPAAGLSTQEDERRYGLELGYQGGQRGAALSLWSREVVALSAHWSSACSCWGLRSGLAWSETHGLQVSLLFDLTSGG